MTQRKDSEVQRSIALDSKRLAEASIRDSSSMKAISVLTMVFLPSTAIAVSTDLAVHESQRLSNISADYLQHGSLLDREARLCLLSIPGLLALLGCDNTFDDHCHTDLANVAVGLSEKTDATT